MKKYTIIVALILTSISGFSQRVEPLLQNEINGIIYMREEEKLARDVYDSLFGKWDVNPFGNIRKSEQVHMDNMKELIDTYKLADPVTNSGNKSGIFFNIKLQKHYNELVTAGTLSLIEALKVGAKIEELDISDLIKYSDSTNNKAILETYSFLKMASENHLRAFVRKLKMQGINYAPSILSNKDFQTIIKSENKGCQKSKCKKCMD